MVRLVRLPPFAINSTGETVNPPFKTQAWGSLGFQVGRVGPPPPPEHGLAPWHQKRRPGVRTFDADAGRKGRLRENSSLLFLNHPATQAKPFSRQYSATKPHSQIHGQSLPVSGDHRLRHGLVQDGRDNATMNRALKTFPLVGWHPCGIDSVPPFMEREMQPLGVTRPANYAIWIEPCVVAGSRQKNGSSLR